MRRFFSIALMVILPVTAFPVNSNIRIRLFAESGPEMLILTPRSQPYKLEIAGIDPVVLKPGEPVVVFAYHNSVVLKTMRNRGIVADSVRITPFSPATGEPVFSLYLPGTGMAERFYNGVLICRYNEDMFMVLNETPVEYYLPGVVKAEGGTGKAYEFYRTQAIIARTFTWQNINKHSVDGYNLCDGTHCQAYHGITDDTDIRSAVASTGDLVLADPDSVIVLAAFHSNCGGQTASSADVWLTSLPHLVSVADPYCRESANAVWRSSIPVESWLNFLTVQKIDYLPPPEAGKSLFTQDVRKQFFETPQGNKLPVTLIRSEFRLRSAFFSMSLQDDSVIFDGRGYGHGVGLCQEGAMAMARKGFGFRDIIKYYYKDVILISSASVKFPKPLK